MVVELGRTTDRSGVKVASIPEWVLHKCRGESWLYGHLSLLAKADDAVYIPLTQLASLTGVSTRTLQKNIAALREAGALAVEPRHDDNGNRLPNRYILHFTPPEVKPGE
jgi:biotin operon repressor